MTPPGAAPSLSAPLAGPRSGAAAAAARERLPFSLYLVELYLVFEYVRLQDLVPGLGVLRLPLVTIAVLALLVLPAISRSLRLSQARAFTALLVLMGLHIPLAVNNYWALQYFLVTGNMLIVFMAVTQVVTTVSRLRHLVKAWLLIHLALALYGITHLGTGPGSFVGDENDFALVMNMFLPFPLFLLLAATTHHRRSTLWAGLCLTLGAVFASLSRGGFLGLVAVGAYSFWRSRRKGVVVVALCAAAALAAVVAPPQYLDEMATIVDEWHGVLPDGTGLQRQYAWRIGMRMFLANPVLGVGQGNFPWRFADYEGEDRFLTRSLAGRAAHSLYLTVLPELGVVGTIIFLALVLALFRDLRAARAALGTPGRDPKDAAYLHAVTLAVEGALVGYLVSGVFISVFYYPPFWILVAIAAATRQVAGEAAKR
jgi:probable O-glycosylation ligase (exosortase A-associated)